ncbi:MAG: PilW family protein [Deltaproteobacteria bacterium]|nr:PilW family protein [Deltaproteobacteria bacterium]
MVIRNRRTAAFSLMELMIALGLMGIIVIYLVQTFTTQQRTYVMVDQVTEAQQNLRAISDLVEREIRLAGFMVDEAGAVCGVDSTSGPDTLFVSDASALDPATAIQPALGARLALGSAPAPGTVTLTLGLGDTTILDGQPAYDTNGDSVNDSDFHVGGGVIVYDRNNPTRGAACGIVASIPSTTSVRVSFLAPFLGGAAVGAQLVVVPAHVYQVNNNAQLLRDGLVLAEDVEDLQIAYFYDADADLAIDAGENPGTPGTPYVAFAWDNSSLREIRLNFVVRTRGADPTFTSGAFQTTENRVAPAVTAQDAQTRRRVHTTTVRVRNVGNRGLLG